MSAPEKIFQVESAAVSHGMAEYKHLEIGFEQPQRPFLNILKSIDLSRLQFSR
jgi:hypothetical protein